ncbi:zincin [Hymenopellis radicata]|nr:zincin [Hymenopellis radicata]
MAERRIGSDVLGLVKLPSATPRTDLADEPLLVDQQPRPALNHGGQTAAAVQTAPLLRDPDVESVDQEGGEQTFMDRVHSIAQEPLTPLTKVLLVVALILLLLSSIFIGLFAGVQHKLNTGDGGKQQPGETITLTATTTAYTTTTAAPPSGPTEPPAEILSSLDTTQDPCENFYQYSNGGWLKSHPLPADKGSVGSFETLAIQNRQLLQQILEAPSPSLTASSSPDDQLLAKIRGMYASCVNEEKLDDIGAEPLVHFVQTLRKLFRGNTTDITGTEEQDKLTRTDKKGLTAALAFLHSRGDVGVDPNYMTLWFSQPSLGLPSKEYYKEKSVKKVYKLVIERLLLTLVEEDDKLRKSAREHQQLQLVTQGEDGSDNVWPPWPWPPWGEGDNDDKHEPVNQTERAHKLAKEVVKFESKIAKASLDLDVLQEDPVGTYNPVPLHNLTDTLPQIHFPRTSPHMRLARSQRIGRDVIEAYLVIRAALTLSPYLGMGTEAWQAQRALVEELSGIKHGVVGDRGEWCIGQVEETLGFAAGRYFVNATFGGESREKGTNVITDIVESFKDSLANVPWMDDESAKAASEKADAIRVKVGFPISPDTRDAEAMARYYSLVKIDENKFFDNIVSAATSDKVKEWIQLGRQRDPEAWEMYPSMVNAYFNPPSNEIVFPAGILQPPFFSKDWPAYLSYGAFGQVAAHELTHAFDSAGRMYNQQGKLEEWWTNTTTEGFQRKQDCIVKQYSAYTIDDGKGGKIHVNESNLSTNGLVRTSGENIGDTGLIQAYRAWKAQYETSLKGGNEYLLPGLDHYTRDQLFFIAFGRIWARNMRPAAAIQRIRTDPHSPTQYRVDGTLFNIPEFAKAFNCSKHAKLNPPKEKQCLFWSE